MPPQPFTNPMLRPDLPTYPVHLQALRVTGGTVPGPSGYASSSVLGPAVYLAYTQQLNPDTLLPRDREPCFALDLNRYGLAPGYYTNCRLAGSYQSLPLYEVGSAPVSPITALSQGPFGAGGLTAAQIIPLNSLSAAQLAVLNNLNPCQLNTLLNSVPISQIHTLTNTLTPTQLTNLINNATPTQLTNLITALNTSQTILLTDTLNQQQISELVSVLTPEKIREFTTTLTPAKIQLLATLPPAQLQYLTDTLTTSQINTLLTNLTASQVEKLFSLTTAQIVTLNNALTPTQIQTFLSSSPLPPTIPSTVNAQTGTSYTFLISDSGRLVTFTNASAMAGTLPSPTVVGAGYSTTIWNSGTGTLTLTPAAGTINGAASFAVSSGTGTTVYSDGTKYIAASGGAGVTSSSGVRTEGTLAATGSVQGDAAPIITDAVLVSGADGTKGVILPNTAAGLILVGNNDGSSSLKVYPNSGAAIDFGGTNNPETLIAKAYKLYARISATQWVATVSGILP